MSDEVAQFLNESAGDFYPSMKFKRLKDFVSGRIIDVPRVVETDSLRNRGEKEKNLVVNIEVTQGKGVVGMKTDEGPAHEVPLQDVEKVTLWIKRGFMAQAVGQAVRDANEETVALGGTLSLAFVDEKEVGQPQPAKMYRAKYEPPVRGINVGDFPGDDDDIPF